MQITEYEKRIKRYADPVNRGKISVDQLCESFKDTNVFKHVKNPRSVVNKLILSPFIWELTLTHNEPEAYEIEQNTAKALEEKKNAQ